MTEDQAKTKWCPMVRYNSPHAPGAAVNRWMDAEGDDKQANPELSRCIGTECMMWRIRKWDSYPEGECPPEPKEGYCGLGGKQ